MLRLTSLLLAFSATLLAPPASAGVYTDDLSKCLVKSTNAQDQSLLMKWVFGALSAHPDMQLAVNITSTQRQDANRQAALLMQRLMIEDCRSEMVSAIKYEGNTAVESAFRVLGEVATRGLMTNPEVIKSIGGIQSYIDAAKFEALAKEAGLPVTPKSPAGN